MLKDVLVIFFFGPGWKPFNGAGWIPFFGAVSVVCLLVVSVIMSIKQRRNPLVINYSSHFYIFMKCQVIFFLLTHTMWSLAPLGVYVWPPPEAFLWMYFLPITLVGLAIEIPACVISAFIFFIICKKNCLIKKQRYFLFLGFILTIIVGWIAFNTLSVSMQNKWLSVRPVSGKTKL